jgi:hypothetical protein
VAERGEDGVGAFARPAGVGRMAGTGVRGGQPA